MKSKLLFISALLCAGISYIYIDDITSFFYSYVQSSSLSRRYISEVADIPASKTGVTIVCDLNGVLLGMDAKKALSEIGVSQILKYSVARNISFSDIESELTKKVYEVFDAIQSTGNDNGLILDPYGRKMPGLMCDWQKGSKTNDELKSLAEGAIEAHPEWFTSDIEKQLVHQVIEKMFTPELLVSTIKIVPAGLHFLKKCKKLGHTLIALSNWDAESFVLLQDKLSDLFMLFDGVMISGFTHHLKPRPEAYEFLVARKKKFNEEIIFIDDQQENIDAARARGLQGILCTTKSDFLGLTSSPDFAAIEKQILHIVQDREHALI